jgi:amino acid adenylation domain-containing protein
LNQRSGNEEWTEIDNSRMRSTEVTLKDVTYRPSRCDLSISQQRLWTLERLYPHNPVHNVSRGWRLAGSLDVEKFERVWQEVVQQHEILRTEFHTVDGVPQPRVLDSFPTAVRLVELPGNSSKEGEVELLQAVREEAGRPFDLSKGPLLRAFLWPVAASEYVFLLVAHRILCDESSLEILLHQVGLHYRTGEIREAGTAQYSDFVRSQDSFSEEQVAYWIRRLTGSPPSLDLPSDRPRPSESRFQGAAQAFSIKNPLLEQIRSLSKEHGATMFGTLLAVFNVLLSRYGRQDDLILGAISGRGDRGLEGLVGPVENLIPLRTDLSGEPTFSELLARVRNVVEEAFAREHVRFEILLDRLPLELDLSRHPLFQVSFCLREASDTAAWGSGISVIPFEFDNGTERFDLSLDLTRTSDSIEGRLSFNTELFEAETIRRMSEHFCTLLAGAAANPSCRIFDFSLLSESERHKVLVEFNATATEYRRDLCIQDFFEEQVERTPDAVAAVCDRKSLTYRELNQRANQVAHHLRKEGVGPEVLVGICMDRSIEMMVGVMGILKAGGAYVPLDPAYPTQRIAVILEDAEAPLVLTQRKLAKALPDSTSRLIHLDDDWYKIASANATNPVRNVNPNNLAYVLFTSGSTGRPKGVALEHRSASMFIQWARDVYLPGEIAGTLFSTSLCFDLSVFEMFVPLSMGGKVIIAQNAVALPKHSAAREVTLINTVPSAIAELIRLDGVPPSVQVVNLAGEALPTSLAQQIYARTGIQKLYNLYGPTEDTTYSTFTLVPRGGEVTIGRPLANTQAYILDDKGQPLPIGIPGELHLAGEGLARGYFGRPDLTKDRFVPNPFSEHSDARTYRTGDLARFLRDGNIQYMGRIDNQVKVRGFRIELGEIEAAVARHPKVQAAVVVAREDSAGEKRLVAYFVPSDESVSGPILKDLVKQHLPEYMVPSAFVALKGLPLSPNGKIDRRRLPAPEWTTAADRDLVPPRDELEVMLLDIWRAVLGIQNFGVRDNFFDLGGHSLMAARVLAEVEKRTGKELPLFSLIRGATIESLARLLEQQSKVERDPVVMEIQPGVGRLLPFFAIVPPGEESLGYAMLARHMGPEQRVYKIQGDAPVTGGKRPYSNQEMRALTDEYVAAMKSVQPRGPYCLGGLCDGTHIAEQIVLKLEAQGDEVGLFAIFDTWVLQHSQSRFLWKIHYYSQRLREMSGLSLSERVTSFKQIAENKVQNAVGSKAARIDWRQAYWPEGFTPTRFRAPVILFKRPKQPFYYINDSEMGWGARTSGGVQIHEIEFHHLEILREPHVGIFGKEISGRLARLSEQVATVHTKERDDVGLASMASGKATNWSDQLDRGR